MNTLKTNVISLKNIVLEEMSQVGGFPGGASGRTHLPMQET